METKISSTAGFTNESQYYTDKQNLEKTTEDVFKIIPNTSNLVKDTDYSANITEKENKIGDIVVYLKLL